VPPGTAARTGALSATLLGWRPAAGRPSRSTGCSGAAPEGERERALADLARLGASTGRAIAAGIALAARSLVGGGLGR
jgi:hypothetical protein